MTTERKRGVPSKGWAFEPKAEQTTPRKPIDTTTYYEIASLCVGKNGEEIATILQEHFTPRNS